MTNLNEKINEKINENIKIQKVFHASFSDKPNFNIKNTFTQFDIEKNGAFHGACQIEGNDQGRKIAENRVFVKIIEDANITKGVPSNIINKVLENGNINFDLLEKETGYVVREQFKNPIMIEADVLYNKALTLNENRTGQWTPFDILREIFEKDGSPIDLDELSDGFTEQELDDYWEDNLELNGLKMMDLDSYGYEEEGDISTEYKEYLFVRDLLESKGYDAIKYANEFEGNGECIMSFRAENVKITNSTCLKSLLKDNNENNLKNTTNDNKRNKSMKF